MSVDLGRLAVQIASLGIWGRSHRSLRSGDFLRCFNHRVGVAAIVVHLLLAKQGVGTLGLTSKSLTSALFLHRITEDTTLKRVSIPSTYTIVCWAAERD